MTRKQSLFLTIALFFGLLAFNGLRKDSFKHFFDIRKDFRISEVSFPQIVSQEESVRFEMQANSPTSSSNRYYKIQDNKFTRTASCDFYWYQKMTRMHALGQSNFNTSFTMQFPSPGNWTIIINKFRGTILVI